MRVSTLLKSSALAVLAATGVRAAQNQLQQITANIGPNPNNVGMFLYKPNKLASPLPLIVAIHYCQGSAQAYFSGTQYATLADQHGFLVIYPNSPRSGSCFDVNTPQTLSHNGGGDSQGIASMVTYAISTYGVDASRVFVTGSSSGAMMTNVMAGSYPELFAAASAYSGVAFGCFAGSNSWNSACAEGQINQTGATWGNEVRAAYPGYTGTRPRMLLWHGTIDTTLYYENLSQEIAEWTNVFGVSGTPATTTTNDPQSGYTMWTYGSTTAPPVVAYSAQNVGHTVPVHETIDLAWFGITGTVAGAPPVGSSAPTSPVSTSPPPVTTSPPPATTTTPPATTQAHWGQCGGIGWTGPTVCAAPYTCQVSNPYYSQCL